jgi:hypothetical protein
MEDDDILRSRVVLPEHVFRRDFPEETVALNLQSGRYHGLNAVAAHMLKAAAEADTVGDAVPSLAAHFEQPEDVIRRDLAQLCRDLEARGLVELRNGGTG